MANNRLAENRERKFILAAAKMETSKHLVISTILSVIIIVAGTAGYMLIEGWDFLDSLYMTVITISTVGFMEVQPMGDPGHLFTIFLVFFGLFHVQTQAISFSGLEYSKLDLSINHVHQINIRFQVSESSLYLILIHEFDKLI